MAIGDDIDRTDATQLLAQLGRRAMPDVSHLADAHLAAMTGVRLSTASPRRSSRGAGGRRRLVVVALAGAAVFIVPSLAIAGVLPDPVQRVAAKVAASVGVELPEPSSVADATRERAGDASGVGPGSGGELGRPSDPGRVLPNGEPVPGKGRPAEGEQRGNRFGQVPDGPDEGKADASNGRPGSTPGASKGSGGGAAQGGKPAGVGSGRPAAAGKPSAPSTGQSQPAASASSSSGSGDAGDAAGSNAGGKGGSDRGNTRG